MNIAIDIKDRRVLKFNNLQTDSSLNVTAVSGIGLEHDLELMEAGEWLVHIDVWLTQVDFASIFTRTSFSLTTAFENIWAEGVAVEYVKAALEVCRLSFNEQCRLQDIDCMLADEFAKGKNIAGYLSSLLHDVEANGLYSTEDAGGYNWESFKLPPGGDNSLVASGTLVVLEEIFFDNFSFNRKKNLDTFNAYIPVRFYTTIKLKLIKLISGEDLYFNLKQLTLYVFMIRCSCTLLLSHHYDSMKDELEQKGFSEEMYNQYIKAASAFLNDLQKDFNEMDVTIINWEEDIDWTALVS